VVDGDQPVAAESNILKLPGEIPESEVYGFISEHAHTLSSLVQQRCQYPNLSQDEIVTAIKMAEIDTTDPHLIFRALGERLGFISEIVVRRGMISIYNEKNKSSVQPLANSLCLFIRNED
jgi:hypothetical protein